MKEEGFKEFDWFDRPSVRRGLMGALWAACFVTLTLGFLKPLGGPTGQGGDGTAQVESKGPGQGKDKGHFGEPLWVPSYALLGLAACVGLILLTWVLGLVLKRRDDYWGETEGKILPEDIDDQLAR